MPPADEYTVKVMDLGIARGSEDDARVTRTGVFVGSLQYAAPEQFGLGRASGADETIPRSSPRAKGDVPPDHVSRTLPDVDGRADLHALGVVLYELSTGANPYQDTDWRVVFQRVLRQTPRRLGEANPQVSPFFEELVHTLLAKDREQRFASAAELVSVLERGEDSAWWTAKARSIRSTTARPLRRIRIPRETALVGRDTEMTHLRACFARASKGEGAVVLVEGEAGIGKSRLVDEFVALLGREGEDLDFLHGSYPPGGAATASGAFTTAYREHFGEEGLAETLATCLRASPALVPAFAALLRGETTPPSAEPLTKDSLQTCFVHATRAIAARRTAVVLIDDLHFAPEEGRALFASLAMAVPGHRILLVGTSRPPLDEKWASNLTRLGHTSRMDVGRLGPKDLVTLLRDALKSSHLAEELAFRIAEKTDGNPFFVFEVLRGLKDGKYLTQNEDGTWATTRVIREIRIPSRVADLIQARVADLGADDRTLLEIAACVGYEFDAALVGDVAGLGRIPLLRSLGTIEKAHRLIRAAGRNFVFDHHQVQEHLYGGLAEFHRESYHAAIAESLERLHDVASSEAGSIDGALSANLCEHLLKGGLGSRALCHLPPAQAHLMKGYQSDRAAALDERALSVPGLIAGAERAKSLLRLCGALNLLGRRARQEEAVREAERLADESGDDELRGQAAAALGNLLYSTGRNADAETCFRRALPIAKARGDRRAEAAFTRSLGSVAYSSGRHAEALSHLERALALGREAGDRQGEFAAERNLGSVAYVEGRRAEARERFERCLTISRETGDRVGEATATGNLGNVLHSEGRLIEAREHQERHLAVSRTVGNRLGEVVATGNLGLVLQSLGRLAEAREHFERYLALSREIGNRRGESYANQYLAGMLREDGELAAAEARLVECLALCEENGDRVAVAETHLALGTVRAGASARDSFVRARDLAVEVSAAAVEVLAVCRLACIAGDAADAVAAFAANEERLSAEELREARWLLWIATGDRRHLAEAKRLLDEAVARVPPEHRDLLLSGVRVNREIEAAAGGEAI